MTHAEFARELLHIGSRGHYTPDGWCAELRRGYVYVWGRDEDWRHPPFKANAKAIHREVITETCGTGKRRIDMPYNRIDEGRRGERRAFRVEEITDRARRRLAEPLTPLPDEDPNRSIGGDEYIDSRRECEHEFMEHGEAECGCSWDECPDCGQTEAMDICTEHLGHLR